MTMTLLRLMMKIRTRPRNIPKNVFSLPSEEAVEIVPLNYFKGFSLDNIINLFVKPKNLYSVQQTGSSINPSKSELEQFFGIQMFMSIISLLIYYMCWTVDTKYLHIVHQPYYVHQSLQKIVSIYSLQWQLRKKQ